MARLHKKIWAQRTRLAIVALAIITLPFACLNYHLACHDPIQNWQPRDSAIQSIEEKYVQQGIKDSHATYGMALTIDANSGQLLSYYRSGSPLRCADAWEPGSAMKPLTIAAALDSGSITPDFTFYDSGSVTVDHQTIFNWTPYPHGQKNLETLLHDSLNVGAVAVVQHMHPKQLWYGYLENHFMLDKNGQGSIPLTDDPNADYRYATSAFGIGVVTTPLQMSLAYASLIDGGIYHPACLSSSCNSSGTRVLQQSTSAHMKQLLTEIYSADTKNIPTGYTLGGKSGTAPMAQPTDEYYLGMDSGTYIGFIEHQGNTYIQFMRLDQPQGYSAASHATRDVWTPAADQIIKLR